MKSQKGPWEIVLLSWTVAVSAISILAVILWKKTRRVGRNFHQAVVQNTITNQQIQLEMSNGPSCAVPSASVAVVPAKEKEAEDAEKLEITRDGQTINRKGDAVLDFPAKYEKSDDRY